MYKLLKFTRRNKTLCIASAAVVLILIAAVIVSSHQAWNAHRARRAEVEERKTAEAQRDRAQIAEKQAEGNLYDALMREAGALRVARSTGYRSQVFDALQQARDLDVPQKTLTGLRTQAIACLGDPVGREPLSLLTLPEGPNTPLVGFAALHPTDPVAAFGLTSGDVILKDLNTAKEIARFECDHVCLGLCFADTGNALLTIHTPMGHSHMDIQYEQTVTRLFVRAQDGTWIYSKTMAIPNVATCMSSAAGFRVIVLGTASRPAHLMDPLTGDTIFEADFPIEINPMDHPQLDLSQDGRLFAVSNMESADLDKSMLSVWDLVEQRLLVRLETHLAACTGVKFSPDGRYIVFLSQSGGKVYSTETWTPVGHLTEQFMNRPEAVFLANSTTLVFSLDSRVVLWDFKKQAVLAQLERPQGGVKWLSASADGKSLMSYHFKQAWLYSLDTDAERLCISGHGAAVSGIAFSPDGTQLASVGMDRSLSVWDSVTGRPLWQRILQGQGQAVSWSADGDWLITSDGDGDQVSIWRAKTAQRVFELDAERQATTLSAKLTGDNRHLVTANARLDSDTGSVAVWNLTTDNSGATEAHFAAERVKSFPGQIIHASLSPDNRQCAFVKRKPYTEVYLYLWDMAGKAEPCLVTDDLIGGFAQMIEFSPDGQQVRAVDRRRCVVSYDVHSGEKRTLFPTVDADETASWNWIIMHTLAPDGATLAMSSRSGLGVDLWDMTTGRLLYALPEQEGATHYLAWSPDGRRLAIARSNGIIEIWNMAEIDKVLGNLNLTP